MAANEPPVIDQEIARLDRIVAKLQAAYRGHSSRKLAAKAAAVPECARGYSSTSTSSWADDGTSSSTHSVGRAGRLQELRYAIWITLNEPSSSTLAHPSTHT
jgi:hypothetical protein